MSLQVHPYTSCQDCDSHLEETTLYRRHAYCPECRDAASF